MARGVLALAVADSIGQGMGVMHVGDVAPVRGAASAEFIAPDPAGVFWMADPSHHAAHDANGTEQAKEFNDDRVEGDLQLFPLPHFLHFDGLMDPFWHHHVGRPA